MIDFKQHFERHHDCMLAKSPDWEIKKRGFATNGMGDLITRTAYFAIALQDMDLLLNCIDLCNEYKRWPDWLEPGKAKRRELKKAGFDSYRSQRSMTRDPFLMTLVAISQMKYITEGERYDLYVKLEIPFWMNRTWLWWYKATLMIPNNLPGFERALLRNMRWRERQEPKRAVWKIKKQQAKDEGKKLKFYVYGRLVNNLGFPMYVKNHYGWMAYTVGAKRVQIQLARQVPEWNYAILLLCEKPGMYLASDFIENYKAKIGFQWAGEVQRTEISRELPLDDKYKLDKDVLDYLWDEYNMSLIE